MAQMSEDGRWYWDGHNWHPVPQVAAPTPEPEPEEAEPEQPGRVSVRPDDVQIDGRDVDFGVGLIVDNAALGLVTAARDTAYALAGMLALLVAFTPAVIASLTGLRRAGRLDATTGLETAFVTVIDTARNDWMAVTLTLLVTLGVLSALRGIVHVRLGTAPWLQAVAAVVIGYAVGEFAGPYLP